MSSHVASRLPQQHTMADWLAVHGLTQQSCAMLLKHADLLKGMSAGDGRKTRSVAADLSAEEAWSSAAQAFVQFCPPSESIVQKVLVETRTNFQPDMVNFPRPFTLHDAGDGRPFVSCAYRHTVGDVMAVAHEFGHALQVTAASGVFAPPVLRETCAFVSEIAVLRHMKQHDRKLHDEMWAVWCSDTARFLGADTDKLSVSLMEPKETYEYRWNYPPARILAIRCASALPREELWQVFAAGWSVGNLILKCGDWRADDWANRNYSWQPSLDRDLTRLENS